MGNELDALTPIFWMVGVVLGIVVILAHLKLFAIEGHLRTIRNELVNERAKREDAAKTAPVK